MNLNDHMAGMAEEVRPVDLRDRVLVSSRRATVRRRALVASAAAVATVALGAGVAWAGRPAPSPYVPAVTPSPSPSVSVSIAPRVPTPGASSVTITLPERLYYLSRDGGLLRLEGSDVRELVSPRTPACGLSVSADHTRVAWVTVDGGGATGDLVVSRLDGSGQKTVLRGVSCTGGNAPYWLPDSKHVLVTRGNTAPRVSVDVRDGSIGSTPFADSRSYLTFSPNGRVVAYQEREFIVITTPEGVETNRVPYEGESSAGKFSVQGVTDDGKRLVVGLGSTDPDQIRTGFRLVDADRGRNLSLPLAAGLTASIHPIAGDRLIVRVPGKVSLLATDGTVLDSRTEPAALRNATMLR